ncbi:protein Flattop [Etheostoma spectabile]|uniref:protein Flattop n=1 Tax=Etheostoma spectabile TaxID=54343 RepID=UPI0013AFA522|nr:protein Flattop [Etheostoma spectabile]
MFSYSANQYDGAFKPHRLQNWCETNASLTHFRERPTAHEGRTTFIADDRGHLLPGVVKKGSAWTDFKGTWDLPARIPAHHINPTGRSVDGLNMLKSWGIDPRHRGNPQPRGGSKDTERLQDVGQQTNEDVQQDSAALCSAAGPGLDSRPQTSKERPASNGSAKAASQEGPPPSEHGRKEEQQEQ